MKIIIVLVSFLFLYLSGTIEASTADFKVLDSQIKQQEQKISARIGVAILHTQKGLQFSYRGEERFPLNSTFKSLACAKLLKDTDEGKLNLVDTKLIQKNAIQEYSPITRSLVGKHISLEDACSATMLTSDNTAANIVLEAVGGPSDLTLFLRNLGDQFSRIDRWEPELNEGKPGDVRDTTTPNAVVATLNELLNGTLLTESSQSQLKTWMMDNQIAGKLFRSVLPTDWKIADRTGAGGHGSRGITAMVWPKHSAPIIIAVYITETEASFKQRNRIIAEIGKLIFNFYSADD